MVKNGLSVHYLVDFIFHRYSLVMNMSYFLCLNLHSLKKQISDHIALSSKNAQLGQLQAS